MIDTSVITDVDRREAWEAAKNKVAILPVRLPRPSSLYPFISWAVEGDWAVSLRLCSIKQVESGGSVLYVSYGGVSITKRIRQATFDKEVRALKRACVALRSLHRLAVYRTNVAEICDNYTGRISGGQEAHLRGSESRKRQASIMRLARKLTGLRGYEGIMFSNWSIPVCEAIAQACGSGI